MRWLAALLLAQVSLGTSKARKGTQAAFISGSFHSSPARIRRCIRDRGVIILQDSGPTFHELYGDRLPDWLVYRAAELGFTRPTEAQRAALDPILDGEDVVLQSQTGTTCLPGRPRRHHHAPTACKLIVLLPHR